MSYVASWSWGFEGGAGVLAGRSSGLSRSVLVGRSSGAVHTEVALCRLSSGGAVGRHVHSFERCAYVLGGEPVVEIDERSYQLKTGDFVLFPIGVSHGWKNSASDEARWVEVSTPLPADPDGTREDTYLYPSTSPALESRPAVPDLRSPSTRWLGSYRGTPPQRDALEVSGPARGRPPAGMDTALLAYSGISIKMLVDAAFGADLLTMFMVDYEPGGAAQIHDHPFEEVYFFLEGEIEGEVEGERRTFRAGEVLFCGVGELHGFFNTGEGRVRWIETQAPQPPRRHSYRWPVQWEHVKQQLSGD